jgi:hypothetical protein
MSDIGLQRSKSPSAMASGRRSIVGKESAVGFQTTKSEDRVLLWR